MKNKLEIIKETAQKNLETLTIKFCESKISNTPFEKNGDCTKPNEICKYYHKRKDVDSCYKTTLTRIDTPFPI